jgi:hypothetical protein
LCSGGWLAGRCCRAWTWRPRATADDVAVPAHDRVRGDQQPQPLAARFRYHGEEDREQGPVRPVQVRAARLSPLQDGELVAQNQDLGGLPCLHATADPDKEIRTSCRISERLDKAVRRNYKITSV